MNHHLDSVLIPISQFVLFAAKRDTLRVTVLQKVALVKALLEHAMEQPKALNVVMMQSSVTQNTNSGGALLYHKFAGVSHNVALNPKPWELLFDHSDAFVGCVATLCAAESSHSAQLRDVQAGLQDAFPELYNLLVEVYKQNITTQKRIYNLREHVITMMKRQEEMIGRVSRIESKIFDVEHR